jgi:NAD(P)H-flavin reductase
MAETFTLELAPTDGTGVPPFAAGQCNMLYVFGMGEVPISISGDPTQPQPLVHTVRTVGAVTRAIGALQRGAVLGVRGPFGSAWPVATAVGQDVVLVAGGLGLAPLRPVLYYVLAPRGGSGSLGLAPPVNGPTGTPKKSSPTAAHHD